MDCLEAGLLTRFNSEILRQGTEAVRPHNLPAYWLNLLVDEAETYLQERTDRRYICLALVASQDLVRRTQPGHAPVPGELAQLDRLVRDYALQLVAERDIRPRQCV